LLRRQLLTRPFAEWRDLFDERGIAAGPIFDISEVFQDPQVKHRGLVSGFDHPDLGFTPAITLPIRYSRTPVRIRGCPPARGEDADEVFGEVLGLSAEQIRHLRASGAI
jgi:crotonobetainyl-CoA:carnitine CoA-transferase CaiB-like acyl-CoA transferase